MSDPAQQPLTRDMLMALRNVQKIIAEAAMTGFNHKDGDWPERLFESQQLTSAAIKKAETSRNGEASRFPKTSSDVKLVPVELTDAMRWAGGSALHDEGEDIEGIWRAILKEVPDVAAKAPMQRALELLEERPAAALRALVIEECAKAAEQTLIGHTLTPGGLARQSEAEEIAARIRALALPSTLHSPEQDPAAAGLQSQSGINRSLSEGTPREGASITSPEGQVT